jgi:hypothetical protein
MNNPEELKPKSEPLRSVFSGATAARACHLQAMFLYSPCAKAKSFQQRSEALDIIMVIQEDVD